MEQYTIIKSAFMLMAFACLIIVTFQLINAFQTQLPIEPGSYDHKGVFPVSEKLGFFFSLACAK